MASILETKVVILGGVAVQLEKRECIGCKVPFWVRPESGQLVHSNQCDEDGSLTNRNWRIQAKDKLRHPTSEKKSPKKVCSKQKKIASGIQAHGEAKKASIASVSVTNSKKDKSKSIPNSSKNVKINKRSGVLGTLKNSAPKNVIGGIEKLLPNGSQSPNVVLPEKTETNEIVERGNGMQKTENVKQQNNASVVEQGNHIGLSVQPSPSLTPEGSESINLLNRCITQLEKLMKTTVRSARRQAAKEASSPQMVNAACASAKQIHNMLRLKLDIYKESGKLEGGQK